MAQLHALAVDCQGVFVPPGLYHQLYTIASPPPDTQDLCCSALPVLLRLLHSSLLTNSVTDSKQPNPVRLSPAPFNNLQYLPTCYPSAVRLLNDTNLMHAALTAAYPSAVRLLHDTNLMHAGVPAA